MTKTFIPVYEKNSSTKRKNTCGKPRRWTEIENPADCRLDFQNLHADKQKFLNYGNIPIL